MKNIKLLLATTAMLSMGAIAANASDLDGMSEKITNFHVKAEIVNTLNLREAKALDFGRIAWDATWNSGEGVSWVFIEPSGDGLPDFGFGGVAFHDGGQPGEVCFTDLRSEAVFNEDLRVIVGRDSIDTSIDLYDENDNKIDGATVDFGDMTGYAQASTPESQGERCIYIGGDLRFTTAARASFLAGKVHGEAVVTVIYNSVN